MANTCGDDRFELIAMARKKLIDGTNISDRPYEMDALDSILFRCWQMGWLDQLRDGAPMTDTEKETLERRIDELCQENERLRKAKDTMRGDAFEIGAMLVKARDENVKLRELVDGLRYCANESHGRCAIHAFGSSKYVTCCPLYDIGSETYGCEALMQELGIEVDA